MLSNFLMWGAKRIEEIPADVKILDENKALEITKLNDRLGKFKEKMRFLENQKMSLASAIVQKSEIKRKEGNIIPLEIG